MLPLLARAAVIVLNANALHSPLSCVSASCAIYTNKILWITNQLRYLATGHRTRCTQIFFLLPMPKDKKPNAVRFPGIRSTLMCTQNQSIVTACESGFIVWFLHSDSNKNTPMGKRRRPSGSVCTWTVTPVSVCVCVRWTRLESLASPTQFIRIFI